MSKRHMLVKIVSGGVIVALLSYGGWSVKALVEENQELTNIKQELKLQLEDTDAELQSLKDQFETIQNLLTEVTSAYEESEKTNVELKKTIESLESQLSTLNTKIKNLTEQNKKLEEEVAIKKANKAKQVASGGATASSLVSRGTTQSAKKTMVMEATAYTAYCNGCSGTTATGINLRANPSLKVIAVDPSVIPLGTKVHVEGYGYAIAGDTGGAIKGNKIDIFIPSKEEAYKWGRRSVTVTILN